jgi:hypothetical protein
MWTTAGWRSWFTLQLLALIVCAVAWKVAADRIKYGEQIGLANISILGLGVSLVAHWWMLQQGRRRIGARRRALLAPLGRGLTAQGSAGSAGASAPVHDAGQVVVAGTESRYYHRPRCPMASGRNWPLSTVALQQRDGRSACRTCTP